MIFMKQSAKLINNILKVEIKNIHLSAKRKEAVNLAYQVLEDDRTKKSTANPIIISHGVIGQSMNWKSVSKCLFEELDPPRKIFVVDNRNHGKSPHTSDHTYDLMTEDTLQLYSTLGLKEAVLLGHSMGGRAFMHTALTYPEKASSLIIVDISPIVRKDEGVILGEPLQLLKAAANIDLSQQCGNLSDVRKYADNELKKQKIDSPGLRSFLLQNLKQNPDGSFGWKINLPTLINKFFNFKTINFENLVYDKSVLLVAGEKSPFVPKSHAEPIKKIFPKARIEYIPDAGHLVHMENTPQFCKFVIDFLRHEK